MISIPAFGAVFIPVSLWIFFFRARYLVPLMLVSSVFVAASVVDCSIGNFVIGVQPFYFTAILVGIRALPVLSSYRRRKLRLEPAASGTMKAFVRFWKWAVATAFVLPLIFKGIEVINQRSDESVDATALGIEGAHSPLHWSFANLGQSAYLTLMLIAFFYVVASKSSTDRMADLMAALRTAIIVVAVLALTQSIAAWVGWSFPYSFFNNNPAYSQGFEVEIEGVRRVNGTFTEPSYAGGFLAAGALGLLAWRLRGGRSHSLAILLSIVGLILTTASTGYATFVIGGVLLVIYLARETLRKKMSRRVIRRSVVAALLVSIVVIAVLSVVPPLRQGILEMTVNKTESLSFFYRISADVYAIDLLFHTYGLGTGLGSNRSSSLVPDLLSTIGIIGTLLFAIFIVRLFGQLSNVSSRPEGGPFTMVAWMLVGLVIAQCVGIADLNWPPLWAVLIAAAGILACRSSNADKGQRASSIKGGQGQVPATPEVT